MNGDFCLHMRDNYIKLGKTPRKIGIRLFSENILTTLHKSFKKLVEWFMRSCFGKKKHKKKHLTDKQVKNN